MTLTRTTTVEHSALVYYLEPSGRARLSVQRVSTRRSYRYEWCAYTRRGAVAATGYSATERAAVEGGR